jgi:hypothetical protein
MEKLFLQMSAMFKCADTVLLLNILVHINSGIEEEFGKFLQ